MDPISEAVLKHVYEGFSLDTIFAIIEVDHPKDIIVIGRILHTLMCNAREGIFVFIREQRLV